MGSGNEEGELMSKDIQKFETGATRNIDDHKFDYEGFLSPLVLERFASYMHRHRLQKDGSLRSSDNWQKGIPLAKYMKSLIRHVFDAWRAHRGGTAIDPDTNEPSSTEELLCAILFNTQGYLHELLIRKEKPKPGQIVNMTDEEMMLHIARGQKAVKP